MKRKKTELVLLVLILLAAGITGCSEKKEKNSEYSVYYMNKDKTRTVAVSYKPKTQDTAAMVAEMLGQLFQDTESPDYRRAMTKEVKVKDWRLENGQLYLYFNSSYADMDNVNEVLCRAAIVRTLVQIEGVDCVSFYVGGAPLTDKEGNPVGLMTADSFIENPGEQINTIQMASITLYFANKDGTKLAQEVQEVHYSSNISMEKLVVEHLLKGPQGKGLRSAIPAGTKLVSVSVLDGVCFLNLDEGFLNQNYEIAEPIVIYSIVNSLVELPNVNKVQIAVNGDSNKVYREEFDLSSMYERNLDYMDGSVQTQEEQIQEGSETMVIDESGADALE